MGLYLSITNFEQSTGNCLILNNTNLARDFYAEILVGDHPQGSATRVWSLSDNVAANDDYSIYPSGMTSGNTYTLYVYYNWVVQDTRVIKFGSGGGGQGGSAGGAGNLGEKITTFNWNSTNWGTARTVWAEEHGTGTINSYGGRYDDPGNAVVPGYSIDKGWVSAQGTYDVYQGTLYAKSTSGANLAATTVTDSEVTINLTTRARSRLYANFPWHGMRVVYEDDSGVERVYFDNKSNQSALTNSNNSWSGTITDAYWCPLTTDWSNVPVSIPYQRELTDKTRKIKVQLYGDIGGFISTSQGTKEFRTFTSTLEINVTIPRLDGYRAEVEVENQYGTASVSDGTTTTDTSIVVPNNTQVTFTAIPITDYVFTGWYDISSGTLVSTNNPYQVTVTSNIGLMAKFEEDTSSKAIYLHEPVSTSILNSDVTYQLLDGTAVRVDNAGTPTVGRIARWKGSSKGIFSSYELTSATSAPATVNNGAIYCINSEDYPNETSYTWGNEAVYEETGQSGDKLRAGLKVVFQSETATTYTVRVYCNLSQLASTYDNSTSNITWRYYENGVNMTPYTGNANLPSGTSTYTNYTTDTAWGVYFQGHSTSTWYELQNYPNQWSCPNFVNQSGNTTCNYYKDLVITKTNSVQNFVIKNTVKYSKRSDSLTNTWSEVEKTIVVPPAGKSTACVGHSGSWKSGVPYVLYNGSWTQVTMYVFDGTQWVKSHYY